LFRDKQNFKIDENATLHHNGKRAKTQI